MENKQFVTQKFADYENNMLEYIMEHYSWSMASMSELRDQWQTRIKYSDEAHQALIRQTQLNIVSLLAQKPNLQDIYVLTVKMAKFLAPYTARAQGQVTLEQTQAETDKLVNTLYRNSKFIKNHKQTRNNPVARKKIKKADEKCAQQLYNEIRGMFMPQNLSRFKRR